MAITSNDIQNQSFKIERRGYDVDEVDVFLERVSNEIDDLNEEVATLKSQLAEAKRSAAQAPAAPAAAEAPVSDEAAAARIAELEAQLKERKTDDAVIAQALIVAQRTADEIVSRAKADAENTRQNAEDEARRILDKANAEKQKVVDHIGELNQSREQIREQYQDLLKGFIGTCTMRLTEIGGDITSGIPADLVSEVAEGEKSVEKFEPSIAAATYTTPVAAPAAAPAAFKPSAAAKDFSGYGDADDTFAFDEID